jgi:branched-chain amino acid aminotransferase
MAEIIPFDQRDGSLWFDGKIVPWREGNVHVLTHGLHFASCVFEGERMYSGRIYKLDEHTKRLFHSAEILGIKIPYTEEEISRACYEAAEAQSIVDGYVRPVVFRGAATMPTVSAQKAGVHVAVAVWPWPSYFDPAEKLKGIRLDISEWKRPAPDTAPTQAKAAGLYMICTISKHAAERKGYADAMMLDWEGRVAECTGANIFFVRDGKIHTPIADCFLDGITRQTVIDLARKRGFEVIERRILPDELTEFSECFITGSAAEVTGVAEIANWNFNPGGITKTLMEDYTAEVNGLKAAAA